MTSPIEDLIKQRDNLAIYPCSNKVELERIHKEILEFSKYPLPPAPPKNAWDSLNSLFNTVFWLGFCLLIVQCNCNCIIK